MEISTAPKEPMDISKYSMETDISEMEAPTFTTIDRSNPASIQALDWDHAVNLVGKKVLNPMIHCCDKCLKPILIYGRMIPCKHVFCLGCAKEEVSSCPRCGDKVSRVEQAGLGNIFLCTQGGSRYGNSGCRRTYLSNRDLQAHIAHRHKEKAAKEGQSQAGQGESAGGSKREKKGVDGSALSAASALTSLSKASLAHMVAAAQHSSVGSPGAQHSTLGAQHTQASYVTGQQGQQAYQQASSHNVYQGVDPGGVGGAHPGSHISVLNSRPGTGNLITVHAQEPGVAGTAPIQGSGATYQQPGYQGSGAQQYPGYTGATPQGQAYPNLNHPPPAYGYTSAVYPSAGYSTTTVSGGHSSGYGGSIGSTAGGAGAGAGYAHTQTTAGYAHTATASGAGGQYSGTGQQYAAQHQQAYNSQQWNRPPPGQQTSQSYYRR